MSNTTWPSPTTTWPFPTTAVPKPGLEEVLRDHNITVTHIFNESRNRGGLTLAWRSCNTHHNTRMVEVAVAYCHPEDTYVRKVGSRLAVDRFLAGNTVVVPARSSNSSQAIIDTLKQMFWTSIQVRDLNWDIERLW